jgi:hypothetical protein
MKLFPASTPSFESYEHAATKVFANRLHPGSATYQHCHWRFAGAKKIIPEKVCPPNAVREYGLMAQAGWN